MQTKHVASGAMLTLMTLLPISAMAQTGGAAVVAGAPAMDATAFYIIVSVVSFVFVLSLLWVSNTLSAGTSKWSLTDALSEEVEKSTTTGLFNAD